MSKMIRLFLTLCLLASLALSAGAAKRQPARKKVMLDKNFVLRVGQEVLTADGKLSIKFVSVPEDSRCPRGVTCIWAGNVSVQLQVTKLNSKSVKIELNTNPRDTPAGEEADCGNYHLKLVSVDPYPVQDQQLAAGDYRVTLVVSKKS